MPITKTPSNLSVIIIITDNEAYSSKPTSYKQVTGDCLGHCWGRNGKFCITVGPVTRTAGILA